MSKDKRTLSEYLLDLADSETARFPALLQLSDSESVRGRISDVHALVTALLESKESFLEQDWSDAAPKLSGLLSDLGSSIRRELDWEITTSLLARVPKFVDRTVKLSELIGDQKPTPQVASYLREATRCYVFGFWQASIALARAAVEDALRTRFLEIFPSAAAPHKFGKVVEVCARNGILASVALEMVNVVKENGDRVLHGGNTNADDAREALTAARGFLERLHR